MPIFQLQSFNGRRMPISMWPMWSFGLQTGAKSQDAINYKGNSVVYCKLLLQMLPKVIALSKYPHRLSA